MRFRSLIHFFFLCALSCLLFPLGAKEPWSPDFVIVGAQKAATGALREFVIQHPKIAFSKRKEVHFFDLNFEKGPRWYEHQFPKRAFKDQVIGEKSPYYIVHPLVPKRMHALYPGVKIVMILRNPVSRAYSHYHFNVKNGVEDLSFEEAIATEEERLEGEEKKLMREPHYKSDRFKRYSYLKRGLYVEQVRRWLDYFPREQILIITSEELSKEPLRVMNELFAFLGLSPMEEIEVKKEVSDYPPMDPQMRQKLLAYFKPYNQKLSKLLGRDFGWDK